MNERPILFTGAMVRAILDGTKSATRRVVKPQPDHISAMPFGAPTFEILKRMGQGFVPSGCIRCPYGKAGDRLRASGITLQITAVRVERAYGDSPWVWVIDFARLG